MKDDAQKIIRKRTKNYGFTILYLAVFIMIVIGEAILFVMDENATLWNLFQGMLENLVGVLAAFLVFDIAQEKLNKDTYAAEISEQILETMMYNPEIIDLYENDQKKTFINSFVKSVVKDDDMNEMIRSYLKNYLLSKNDLMDNKDVKARDCRIRTAFSYRFVLESERTNAFKSLPTTSEQESYFFVQEELNYTVKYLTDKGSKLSGKQVRFGLVYDNRILDGVLRDSHSYNAFANCIFRENLEIEDIDKAYIESKETKQEDILKIFRPYIVIDGNKGINATVEIARDASGKAYGIVFVFDIEYDRESTMHDVGIIFHMPKKWNSILEVCIVDPTKDPMISLSYNEDHMDIEMYSFLNKNDNSSVDNSLEADNGIFSISISNEWVFPISGMAFHIKRKETRNNN